MSRTTRLRLEYGLTDYVAVNIGWLLFNVARYLSLPEVASDGTSKPTLEFFLTHYQFILLGQLIIPLCMLGLYAISGFYNDVRFKSRMDDLRNSAIVGLIGTLGVFFIVLINDTVPERLRNYEQILLLYGLLTVPPYITRSIITLRQRRLKARGEFLVKALIAGPAARAVKLARRLSDSTHPRDFDIEGIIDTKGRKLACDIPVYGKSDVDRAIAETGAQAIIVVADPDDMRGTLDFINRLYRTELTLLITLDLYQLISSRTRLSSVVGEPLINISRPNLSPATTNLKRLADICGAALALVVLSPVMAVIAAMIKRDSSGPVFYRQERIGYRKKTFKIIKFRTMRTDAEAGGAPRLSQPDDPRITAVGRVLRKYRFDELPQFWNVLVGEMSLVGPRPEREFFARQIIERAPYYSLIHQVRPGITSLGMVKFGYASTVDEMLERLRYDLLYIENISPGLDLKILFHTVNTVITGKGV